jgi:hypothetical protein
MSERNKAVTLKFIEAMGSNDPQGAAECLAPDGMAVTKGFGKASGTRKADTVIAAIESFKALMPTGLRLEVRTVTAEGDRVVVEAIGNAVTGEGKPYCNEYCFVATFEDGKIKLFNEYLCTKLAEDVLWPLVEKMGALKADAV